MSRFAVLVILVVAAIGCDQGSAAGAGAGAGSGSGSAVASAPTKNPGGGFSADLAKKLDTSGSGNDTPLRTNNASGSADAKAGSADAKVGSADAKASSADAKAGSADTKAGSADAKAGSAAAKTGSADVKVAAGSADMKAGSAAKVEPTKVEPKPPDTKLDSKAGSATAKVESKPPDVKAGSVVSTAPKIDGSVVIATTSKGPVNTPAELKAINISLLPNWERDAEAAGTLSLVVKLSGKTDMATFLFRYGIEDAKAPSDRDAYKKWLADNKIFTSKDDRQKGAAWYLEGVDGAGKPAFRMVVIYGGKKLICYGSLYKDSSLGDLRDQTIIQAKQICETLTL